jgi:alpha-1,3/alpha-1,6-mannosyltransferase
MKIVFIHLDWGIGGAEQLMLQLAMASRADDDTEIQLLTTRCDADHCFAALRDRPCPFLHICGSWIPAHVYGHGQVVFSTIRLLYLACVVITSKTTFANADLIVTDVLPTPLLLLRFWTKSALLFYCHFPDRLLGRGTERKSRLFRMYRSIMDHVESISMDLADTIAVNSNFTRNVVLESFPQLAHRSLPVLYPALEEPLSAPPSSSTAATSTTSGANKRQRLLVSLNRFERKKNLRLLIDTVVYLHETYPALSLPRVILAGGYDPRNIENVEHRADLGQLVALQEPPLQSLITFEHSITDARRAELLRIATVVVYTPDKEHFGIVPVEAMAAGTPVVCCRSGGPVETVLDGITGFLCNVSDNTTTTNNTNNNNTNDNTNHTAARAFGEAIKKLLDDPEMVEEMGAAARQHAISTFGTARMRREWHDLVQTTIAVGRQRVAARSTSTYSTYRLANGLALLYEPLLCCLAVFLLSWFLHAIGVLEDHENLFQGLQRMVAATCGYR